MEIVKLVGNQEMQVQHATELDVLRIFSADQKLTLEIQITPSGPVVHLHGAGLTFKAEGKLAIEADELALHGRSGVAITSDGNAEINIKGDLLTQARTQEIVATHGNTNLKANDDIRINGERVLVNC